MTVTNVHKDPDALTMTMTVELDATVERAWQLWADPRQLERWWGPPGYPATFVDYDLVPGSLVTYFMTSPEGDKHHGWWEVLLVDAPRRLPQGCWLVRRDAYEHPLRIDAGANTLLRGDRTIARAPAECERRGRVRTSGSASAP